MFVIETIRYKLALLLLGTTLLSFSAPGQEPGWELGQKNGENIEYIDVWAIVESKGGVEAEISDKSLPGLKGEDSIESSQYKAALLPFGEVIQLVPGSIYPLPPWSGKGFALAALGRYYESVAAFNKVPVMESSNADNADPLHAEGPSPLASGDNSEAYMAYMALSDTKDIRYTG